MVNAVDTDLAMTGVGVSEVPATAPSVGVSLPFAEAVSALALVEAGIGVSEDRKSYPLWHVSILV